MSLSSDALKAALEAFYAEGTAKIKRLTEEMAWNPGAFRIAEDAFLGAAMRSVAGAAMDALAMKGAEAALESVRRTNKVMNGRAPIHGDNDILMRATEIFDARAARLLDEKLSALESKSA